MIALALIVAAAFTAWTIWEGAKQSLRRLPRIEATPVVVEEEQVEDEQEQVEDEEPAVVAASSESKTTANCNEEKGSNITYKSGKPILSITFSLSEEHPFEVNVGSTMSYKRSDKKAYPVLYEIQDLTNPSRKILIKPLKNKFAAQHK